MRILGAFFLGRAFQKRQFKLLIFSVFLSAFLSFKSFSVFDVMVVVRWRSIPDNKAEFKPFFSEGGRLGGVC